MDSLSYLKYIIKAKENEHVLTLFEKAIYTLYIKYMHDITLNDAVYDTQVIIDIVNYCLKDKKIIVLVFSNGNVRYVEKEIIMKCEHFCSMIQDVNDVNNVNNNVITLSGILDNEIHIDVLLFYLKFNTINYPSTYNLDDFMEIVKLFDYVCCDLYKLLSYFTVTKNYLQNITFENINEISYFIQLNRVPVSFIDIYKCYGDKWIDKYGMNEVLGSTFFKVGILPYNYAYSIVLDNNYYPYFYEISSYATVNCILNKLFDTKLKGWWFIVDTLNTRYNITSELNKYKELMDITFFDTDITSYDISLVSYMKNKFGK